MKYSIGANISFRLSYCAYLSESKIYDINYLSDGTVKNYVVMVEGKMITIEPSRLMTPEEFKVWDLNYKIKKLEDSISWNKEDIELKTQLLEAYKKNLEQVLNNKESGE